MSRRNSKFREDEAIAILGIPQIVVLALVDIHIQTTAIIRVDIGNKEICNMPSMPLPAEIASWLYFIWDIKVREHIAPTGCFLA